MMRLSIAVIVAGLLTSTADAAETVRLKIQTFNIWYGGEQVDFSNVIAAIKLADADIVGLQEPDGNTLKIAELAGYPYADIRRHIISKYPLFDSGTGERSQTDNPLYSTASVDANTVHAWAEIAPGKVIAVANTHLTSNPYGPELVRDGSDLAAILQNETDIRMAEAQSLVDGLTPLAKAGTPVFLTGDFNAPSHRDWTEAMVKVRPAVKFPIVWPVSKLLEDSGFTDSFRAVYPDPVKVPGLTWTAGYPNPYLRDNETHDRIDFIWSAHATATQSQIIGEAGNPEVALSVTPWPSDHRSVVSSFDVVPVEAPALINVEPSLVAEGGTFLIRVNSPAHANWTAVVVPRGGNPATDGITGIADIHPGDRPTIKLSTIGMDPGAYDAVMLDAEGKELARNHFSVSAADQKAVLSVDKPTIKTGDDIVSSWSGSPGFRFDWLGVYKRHDTSVYNYLGFVYTGATHEGKMTLPADVLSQPLEPGDYEVRLQKDDSYVTLAIATFKVEAK